MFPMLKPPLSLIKATVFQFIKCWFDHKNSLISFSICFIMVMGALKSERKYTGIFARTDWINTSLPPLDNVWLLQISTLFDSFNNRTPKARIFWILPQRQTQMFHWKILDAASYHSCPIHSLFSSHIPVNYDLLKYIFSPELIWKTFCKFSKFWNFRRIVCNKNKCHQQTRDEKCEFCPWFSKSE